MLFSNINYRYSMLGILAILMSGLITSALSGNVCHFARSAQAALSHPRLWWQGEHTAAGWGVTSVWAT
jgi:hypothetical protein